MRRPDRLQSPLYVICDVESCGRHGWDPLAFVDACLDGGARLIQIRAKSLAAGALLTLVDRIVALAAPVGAQIIVNDRADVARLAGAAGVHVGQEDLTVTDVRRQLGSEAIVGLSTHTDEQVLATQDQPVTYVAIGPVFDTATKPTSRIAVGRQGVRRARAGLSPHVDLVAIGGITLDRAGDLITAGATAVAVIGDLFTPHPRTQVAAYLERLPRNDKV